MFNSKMNQSQFFSEFKHTTVLGDDCNGQVSESTVLDDSNSESEFSENDLSDTSNSIKKPTVMQIIREWALQELNVPKSPITSVTAV